MSPKKVVPTYRGMELALVSGNTVVKTSEDAKLVIDQLLGRKPVPR